MSRDSFALAIDREVSRARRKSAGARTAGVGTDTSAAYDSSVVPAPAQASTFLPRFQFCQAGVGCGSCVHASQSAPLTLAITAGSQEPRSSCTCAGQFAGAAAPQTRPTTRWGRFARARRASPGREQGHDGTSRAKRASPSHALRHPESVRRATRNFHVSFESSVVCRVIWGCRMESAGS